ncbi:oligoendopeptidase F [bacterium]|nr:oligoendopeptidase F [bacterium]
MKKIVLTGILMLTFGFIAIPQGLAADDNGEKIFYENRDDIPAEYRWSLDDIFSSVDEFNATFDKTEKMLEEVSDYEGKIGESAEMLAKGLDLQFAIWENFSELQVYAGQNRDTDTRVAEANELYNRVNSLGAQIGQALSFFEPEISAIDAKKLKKFMKDKEVKKYEHVIDNIVRMKPHIRSSEVEDVLASASLLSRAPYEAYSSMVYADVKWPTIIGEDGEETKVTPALYYSFVSNQDRRIRRDAALALFGTYSDYAQTFAATYGGHVQRDILFARNRNYESSIEMALNQVNVPVVVVETLVNTVHENREMVHRYASLRKEVMELDEFHVYDLYVSLVPDGDKKITYEEGMDIAMDFWRSTLGEEYASVAKRSFDERWVDVYASEGKRGGAYSWGSYRSHPYLLLNWAGTMEDVFTLVHEMGHSVHTYLANENQPYHYSEYSLFVAEVASVASEALFMDYMLQKTDDPTERLFLLNMYLNNITGTFLRQIFFHEFEANAHAMGEAGEPMTKESLGNMYADLWKDYYGPELVLDEEFYAGWSRIPHFYRTFYVWVYATSFAAGEAIAQRFRDGDDSAVQDYLDLLKKGGSVYPMDALKATGVDLTNPKVIRTVMKRYDETLTEMERLLLKQ